MTTVRFSVRDRSGTDVDVVADYSPASTVGDLVPALSAAGAGLQRAVIDGAAANDQTLVADSGLVHGSLVTSGSTPGDRLPNPGHYLVVIGGPEAGAWFQMAVGRPLVVGRTDGDVVLDRDELLSGRHVEFLFDGEQVVVTDAGSSNGTIVEGDLITDPTVIGTDTYIHAGSSVLTVVAIEPSDASIPGARSGSTMAFNRTFREALPELEKEIRLPRRPSSDSETSSLWWRSLLPLLSGVGFAVMTGNPLFLLISGLAPLVYAGDAYRQKRRRARTASDKDEQWRESDAAARLRYEEVWREERRRRRTLDPFGGSATVFAALRHRRLWERRPTDDDFAHVTVGLAPVPSTAALLDAGGDDIRRSHHPMWGTPVNVDLLGTGSLAILGDAARGRAIARSMLMSLATTHSPSDVRIWVFADGATANEWAMARWLPHAMRDEETCQLATEATARSSLMRSLRQVVDQRREERSDSSRGGPVLPLHIAFFDGADVAAGPDFNEVFDIGAEFGVVGVVVDALVAPEGTMGTLQIGEAADEAVFQSRSQPRIDDVLTAEMPTRWAEPSARRLAALRPANTGRAGLGESARLANLVGADDIEGRQLAERWRSTSGTTRVDVGTVADSSFALDLIRDGPHGLVGGMTRSGKTEFLKTLITSLAWANHPDDLCFVIVDFKGGVDYTAAVDLPHVLEVSSNDDLGRFERTIRMLGAELERRQSLFRPLEVANLDAYRDAQRDDPRLAPIPRMIVLIDEFGEMHSSDVGREQLRQIDSMARIGGGLGVHLLLVTQNFEGQLPDQVAANAGFRVCFRVQDPSHSKIVINSGIASTLPASAKGRGYARVQGADPVEFQSARVAGRRPELEAGDSGRVTARIQHLSTLTLAFKEEVVRDVRAGDTDMARLFQVIDQATRLSGWSAPAVPWPSELPDDVALETVMGGGDDGRRPVGLADLPDEQRQVPFSISLADDHIALLGGPRADLNSALITIATSFAVCSSPDDLHIYGIDFAGRGLGRIAGLPHCGAVASRSESVAMRIARHLVAESEHRRSELSAEGVTSLSEYEQRTGRRFHQIVLLIAGAERLSSVGSYDEASPTSPMIAQLLAEGADLGIQVIAAGLPTFASYRPGSIVERRIVFGTADPGEYLNYGCPRSMLSELGGARRGVDIDHRMVVQICSLAAGEVNEADALDAIIYRLDERWPADRLGNPPREFPELTYPLRAEALDRAAGPPTGEARLPLGLHPESADVVWLDPARDGRVMFVAGGRRSGRSTVLHSVGRSARASGWEVIFVAPDSGADAVSAFDTIDLENLEERLAVARGRTLVLIDDLDRLPTDGVAPVASWALADLVVAAGPTKEFSMAQRGLVNLGLSPARGGLVLAPKSFGDVEILGLASSAVSQKLYDGARPGQGVFGGDGEFVEVITPTTE